MTCRVSVIIPAAGMSRRMRGAKTRKPFILLKNKAVLGHLLPVFEGIAEVSEIILVVNKKDVRLAEKKLTLSNAKKPVKIIEGGRHRKDSCFRGFLACDESSGIILIHDGARPFITQGLVRKAINAAAKYGASVVAVPVTSTIKQADARGFVRNTPPRKFLWQAQTPQAFKREILRRAFTRYKGSSRDVTDDSFLVERLRNPVKIVMGAYDNIKLSTPEDLIVAREILRRRKHAHARRHRLRHT